MRRKQWRVLARVWCLICLKASLVLGYEDMFTKMFAAVKQSQGELVDHLVRRGDVRTPRVEKILRSVDRRHFINSELNLPMEAYQDNPLPIGQGQTISAPHMHAIALELMEPYLQMGGRVLDVGSGSGYLTVCLAKMVGPQGYVLGVEKVPELVQRSLLSIEKAAPELKDYPGFKIRHGNVLADVLQQEEPFCAIHVGAAADEIPQILVDKLAPGGRMVIPVGPRYSHQVLLTIDRDLKGVVTTTQHMDVGYVPLTRPSEGS